MFDPNRPKVNGFYKGNNTNCTTYFPENWDKYGLIVVNKTTGEITIRGGAWSGPGWETAELIDGPFESLELAMVCFKLRMSSF